MKMSLGVTNNGHLAGFGHSFLREEQMSMRISAIRNPDTPEPVAADEIFLVRGGRAQRKRGAPHHKVAEYHTKIEKECLDEAKLQARSN